MYAIAFDLVAAETEKYHPKGVSQAYQDIGLVLVRHGFRREQGSLHTTDNENMAVLFLAFQELRALFWFPKAVRDIRAFRVEQWSDFTPLMKAP